jgi:hypothetical protein
VGLVITVPHATRRLSRDAFTVTRRGHSWAPNVRQLSPGDVQLALAPDTRLSAAQLRLERAAAAQFLVGLPAGAQSGVVNPSPRSAVSDRLTRDPPASVARVAELADRHSALAAARLATALSAFSRGPRVRRTVVLVVTSGRPLNPDTAARFRQQLAASGTVLYVLDTATHGAPAFDALAAGSGGFPARIRAPGDWRAAFKHIIAALNEQYYLRFTDTAPLPGRVSILVRAPGEPVRTVVHLPAANPAPPRPLPMPQPHTQRASSDRLLVWLAALLVILGVSYGLGMLAVSRCNPRRRGAHQKAELTRLSAAQPASVARRRPMTSALPRDQQGDPAATCPLPATRDELFFVFLMPCLNEEKVIMNSLQRLLSMPGGNFVVMVIDDGSDDDTIAVVSAALGERVWLLSRELPQARQGKGEALNAAIRYLTGSGRLAGRDPDDVIVVVVDADGRLDPHAVAEVSPFFAEPAIGAVQIGVRINNRQQSRLARMQDMEFVIYTEVFQRGRRHLGSVGLGGNGQFMRLSALLSLGAAPWTRSLTDDLDLGVRLLTAGWRNEYCAAAAVHQQGVVELPRLIRQRSRWFQGHLQSWKLIPLVLRGAPRRARADLLYHLSSPAILLIASLLSMSFLLSVANCVVLAAQGRDPLGWWVASTYALTFGPALIYSYVYWIRERDNGVPLLRVACFAHLYVCYSMMWYASGWWAVGRTLCGRTGWAKTDRVMEAPAAQPVLAAVGASGSTGAFLRPVAASSVAASSIADGSGGVPRQPAGPGDWWPPGAPGPIPAAPAVPAPRLPSEPPPRRRKRRRLVTVTATAALAGIAFGAVMIRSGILDSESGRGQWVSVFNGYGQTAVTGSGANLVISLSPKQAQTRSATHAALVVSARHYGDFVASAQVRTVHQLRRGAAGHPHPWEVGWVIWHYTSDQHFYALTLEPTGWLLSKQDPAYRGRERFLASGRTPRFRLGSTHRIGIVQIGNRITVSADGRLLTQFTDNQRPYRSGAFGVYSEDSDARFGRIELHALPAPPHASVHVPATGTPVQTGDQRRNIKSPSG